MTDLVADTAERIARRHVTHRGGWDPAVWEALDAAGLTRVGVDEVTGGSGGSLFDAAAILEVLAREGAAVPFVEATFLGGWLLGEHGVEIPDGILTVAGSAERVPWGRIADHVVVVGDGAARLYDVRGLALEEAINLAGEPNDHIDLDAARPLAEIDGVAPELWRERGALARSIQMVGALDAVRRLCIRHAVDREQFGRPIAAFQSIQQHLAVIAGEVASARAALEAALHTSTSQRRLGVAVAKTRTGEAAGRVAALAHQIHGAIGVTDEHVLHRYTTRLWMWRDDYGSEHDWADELAAHVVGATWDSAVFDLLDGADGAALGSQTA